MYQIIDLHIHAVPFIDDGASDTEEAAEVLRLCEKQSVTDVFCTSHSGCLKDKSEAYFANFEKLKDLAEALGIKVRLHRGCEVLFSAENIKETLHYLETGVFSTLGESEYVLTELYPDLSLQEALYITEEQKKHGYKPIIAHAERIYSLNSDMIFELIKNGALIQVNAFNLVDDSDSERMKRARELLNKGYIHFIGSDGHNVNTRPPLLSEGVGFILDNADKEYALEILNKNALRLL